VNGTAALHIALLVLGVQPDDEVIVPTLTFIAPVNVIRYCGANPVFMDCDDYYTMDAEKTVQFIQHETEFKEGVSRNKKSKQRISAILPVHIFGNAADLSPLQNLCRERNIHLIEDATESLGTQYTKDNLAGRHAGTVGRIGCLSFNGNKIITTGGGGMLLTDEDDCAERAKYLTTQAKDDDIFYIHENIGYNYRLTNIQAALGVAQLEQLPEFLRIKRANYDFYKKDIDPIPGLCLADTPPFARNNHWMYPLRIEDKVYGKDRDGLLQYLLKNGVQTRPIWKLNHLQKPYRHCRSYLIEKATALWRHTLNIPCSVNLTVEERNTVIGILKNG
jgi:perosamine synthetase